MSLNTCLFYIADMDLGVFYQPLVVLGWDFIGSWKNFVLSLFSNLIKASQQILKAISRGECSRNSVKSYSEFLINCSWKERNCKKVSAAQCFLSAFFPPLVCLCVFISNLTLAFCPFNSVWPRVWHASACVPV